MNSTINNAFVCRHCKKTLPDLDAVPTLQCFFGREVFMDCDNVLYTPDAVVEDEEPKLANYILESVVTAGDDAAADDPSGSSQHMNTKQPAVWSKQATLALLSLYDANKNLVDNPKKQGKLWTAISAGLFETWGIEMSNDQVRWKMNALIQKYHECIDNNSKSGRGTMVFEFLEQMEEIFQKQSNVAAVCTVASNFPFLKRKAAASGDKASKTESQSDAKKKSVKSNSSPPAGSSSETRVRRPHGTGSKLANAKIELEKQWLSHLANKENRDNLRDARHEKMLEKKKEALQLKKRQLSVKEKECEVKKLIAENKLKDQAKRHDEIMELEKLKCNLMQKYLRSKVNESSRVSSDSDDE